MSDDKTKRRCFRELSFDVAKLVNEFREIKEEYLLNSTALKKNLDKLEY